MSGGVPRSNTFDLAGNPLSDGINSYVHDGRGRLTSATGGGVTTSYLINYRGLRVKKSNSLETKNFVYDDAGHVIGEYDGNGNAIQELIWLGDTPVAVTGTMPCLTGTNCTETGTAYVWTDHLNTPRELTRVNGSGQHISIWKWDSLPFGETTPNGNPSNLGVMTFNHRFPGQYYDKETGLHQNWNRDYDPKIGRYVQSDPIGLEGGINTYQYVGSSPIHATDNQGLASYSVVGQASYFFGNGGAQYKVGMGVDTAGQACFTVTVCGRAGSGASTGVSAGAEVNTKDFTEGNSSSMGIWGNTGAGSFGSCSVSTSGDNVKASTTAGVGAGVAGGGQVCETLTFCVSSTLARKGP